MRAIIYMLRKTVKNAFIDTIHHPLKFFMYLLLIMSMIYGIAVGFTANSAFSENIGDKRILFGAYLALLYFISIPVMLKGLSTGTSFFTMSDVTNIFVSPISEKKILIYGIGRQLATMIVLVVCFTAYGSMAVRMFDITVFNALILIGGIVLMLIMVQLITILIFCICSTHKKLNLPIKYFIYLIPVYAIASVTIYMFKNGMTLENLYAAISQPLLDFAPVIGWLHGLVFGIINANYYNVIIFSSLLFLLTVLSIIALCVSKLDYYEDVLDRAESYYEFRSSIKEGRVTDTMWLGSKKIKLKKIGIKHGFGAAAFFFKHIREGKRRSRFLLFNINTVVLLFISLLIGFAMKSISNDIAPTIIFIAVVIICSYIQFFFSTYGDWVKELNKPYIYLVPDSAVKKLIMASATSLIKPFTDAIIAFSVLEIFVGANITDVITSILVYGSFGAIYISSNILAQRIVGMSGSRGIFITFYMSLIMLTLLPGIILGILAIGAFGSMYAYISMTIIGIPVFCWNYFVSFMIFLLCRNLLNNIE